MTQGVYEDYEGIRLRAPAFGRLKPMRALPGVAVAASSVFLLFWAVYVRPGAAPPSAAVASNEARPAANPFGALSSGSDLLRLDSVSSAEAGRFGSLATNHSAGAPVAPASGLAPSDPFGGLGDLQASVSWQSLALRPALQPSAAEETPPPENQVAAIPPPNPPLPPRRPSDLAPAPSVATPEPVAASTPSLQGPDAKPLLPDVSGALAHWFNGVGHPTAGGATANANHSVAAAAPETTVVGRSTREDAILRNLTPSAPPGALARYDQFTAVYDIAARTLYMPNGARIEAHSGYGELKDDPKHVNVRALGATPPDVYELTLRESLFHGVQALRLKPVGSGDQFGRTGLLAHPYMLGEGGDSNGCVSVKDYDAFLQAYQSGQVKKLVVVARLD